MKRETKNMLLALGIAATFGIGGYVLGANKEKVVEKIKEVPAVATTIEYNGENCDQGFEMAEEYLSNCSLDGDQAVSLVRKATTGIPQECLEEAVDLQANIDLTAIDELLPYANAVKNSEVKDRNVEYANNVVPEGFMDPNEVTCLDNVAGDARFVSLDYKGKEIIPTRYSVAGNEQIGFVEKSDLSQEINEQLEDKLSLKLEKELNVPQEDYVMVGPPSPN